MARTIGIDLGTTNSVVSCIVNDRVETIPNAEGHNTTPSIVLFGDKELVVGEFAKRQIVTQPGLVVKSSKRLMGRRFSEVRDEIPTFPFLVVEGSEDRAEIHLANGKKIPPELVASRILKKMVETAEDFLGDEVTAAVITVPAHFNDTQRTATKRAAELINLEVTRIINEPTAAALAYGLNRTQNSQTIAVFDFGGGTFDISTLQLHDDIFEVLSTNGNTQLGGDNIDQTIYVKLIERIKEQTGLDPSKDIQAEARIREAAEKSKIELSVMQNTHISLPFIVSDEKGPKHYEGDLTREEFTEWNEELFQALLVPCQQALDDAKLTPQNIDEVLLVGGSTRIPRVQELVTSFFQKQPNSSINPDEAVALGAAIQAGSMKGELAEILLLDVTPLSLGIELAGGVFKPLIERNSSIPCEASRSFTTVVDNQPSVLVHVLQGERAVSSENRSLARFRLTGITPMPKEIPEIEVTFRIDANGILEVSALDLTSGQSTGVQIEGYGDFAAISIDEIEQVLADMKSHKDEDKEFIKQANTRAKVEQTHKTINHILEIAIDNVSETDLKNIKETMLRLDLALNAKDWMMVETHQMILQELIEKYEFHLEVFNQLNSHFNMPDYQAPLEEQYTGTPKPQTQNTIKPNSPAPSPDSKTSQVPVDSPQGTIIPKEAPADSPQIPSIRSTSQPSPPRQPIRPSSPIPQALQKEGILDHCEEMDLNDAPPPPPPA
jgi:molecular chaperone DnaK